MKIGFFIISSILLLCFAGGCTVSGHYVDVVVSPSMKTSNRDIVRVGIADFSFARQQAEQIGGTSISRPPNVGEMVTDAMADLPMRLGYEVIERKQLEVLLKEYDLTTADLVRPETGVRVGRTLGIQAVIMGTVNEMGYWEKGVYWGNSASFSARLVHLETGQVLWTIKCERAGQEGLEFILRNLTEDAARKLASEGVRRQAK